jgi:cytochrome c5
VQAVLEANCVHCHGDNRLSTMPSIHDSHALVSLIGSGKWVVPGKPEQSRFFQVVTFPDQVPGAMPPTGHAISKQDVATLRQWITAGAKVPPGPTIQFTPRGEMPRSM